MSGKGLDPSYGLDDEVGRDGVGPPELCKGVAPQLPELRVAGPLCVHRRVQVAKRCVQ